LTIGCAANPDAQRPLPSSTSLLATATPVTRIAAPPASAPRRAAASDTTPEDSAPAPHLIPGRSKHDASSFRSAVAYGRRRMATWPTPPDTLPGSILPSHRIVAFYGNPLAKRMGVLGEYPVDVMFAKLDTEVDAWQRADSTHVVVPALQLIAVSAQADAGRDGMYRLRMGTGLIEKVYGWAQQKHGLLFLDIQVGHSTMKEELPRLLPFLARPDVELAIDPEFWMHHGSEGVVPGKKFGQMDAKDINWVSEQLQQLVAEKHIPPKILVIHRFRTDMVTHASDIHLDPRVQIVMDMDGFGPPWQKFESYRDYIDREPVEYTGFKIFYHNDVLGHRKLLTPMEVLQLRPAPLYIQYQ
jgi:hypothetical protein